MYHIHTGPNTEMMLLSIRRESNIFMSEAQYQLLRILQPDTINLLYTNRAQLAQLMFFNNIEFDRLIQLSLPNLRLFFRQAQFGAINNIERLIDTLLTAQSQSTPVIVVESRNANFSSQPVNVTAVRNTMFSSTSHAHAHAHASRNPHGPLNSNMGVHGNGSFSMGHHGNPHTHGHR